MKLEFTVDGKPIGKARPRVTKRATYTPAATTRYEDLVRYAALSNLKEDFKDNEPLVGLSLFSGCSNFFVTMNIFIKEELFY